MFSNDNDNVNYNDTADTHKRTHTQVTNLIFDSLPKNQLKLIDNVP